MRVVRIDLGIQDGPILLAEWTLAPVDLWAIFPTGRMASAKVKAFVAFVEAALRRDIA